MSDFYEQVRGLSPQRLALLAVELKEQLDAAHQAAHEPVAVIGMACRFPGADGLDAYWTLLHEGKDAIREIPPDRWDAAAFHDADPDAPGRMTTRSGGFLDRIDEFDPAFFGIAPREALVMDPQQRLLLEVCWEALEHAGLAPNGLVGSRTGVFVGICNTDYHQLLLTRGPDAIEGYLAQGSAHSVASGRVAYLLGFEGPALSIDTSCSSSLVAIHAACRSLRSGESTLALAGGVNVICSPATSIALSKGRMLAPDGRCKAFDAAGDGFARGEGCGVVVLKPLAAALRDGDRVLAVVRGTAVNQDGRSGGLTVPNGPAQEAVISEALADGGVSPNEIDYVEAHGTGTSLGDPIEARALARALGEGRDSASPLVIGSVKTNFGHLESAAGVAGFMKVILALQHEEIPPQLHFRTPSPHIDWERLPITVAAECRHWPRVARPRRAGVSSFGFSGTNAHAVLEEAPVAATAQTAVDRPVQILPLSARTGDALRELAASYANALDGERALADLAHTAAVGRTHFEERVAIVAADAAEARDTLRAVAAGRAAPGIRRGVVRRDASDVVFMFTGAGAQYPGMARALYAAAPVFRDAIDRCGALLGTAADGRTLHTVLFDDASERPPVHDIVWTQPAMFAVEYGLAMLWRSWGIEPAAVIGHSVGEYVAAWAAGVFSFEDGLRLIAERGRLMGRVRGGVMAAVYAPVDEVAAAIAPLAGRVAISAINAADSVVIGGEPEAVESVIAALASRHVEAHRLFVDVAAHSPFMDPILDGMETAARGVPMAAPRIPLASNVTGLPLTAGTAPDARYWRRHMREPVRFAEGVAALHADGFRTFLEVGPHPTLMALAQRTLPSDTCLVGSLRRGRDDWREMFGALAELYCAGATVDWAGVDAPYARRRVDAPTYPFQRTRYWAAPAVSAWAGRGGAAVAPASGDPSVERLFHAIEWHPAEIDAAAGRAADGTLADRIFIVLAEDVPLADAVVQSLAAAGGQVVRPRPGEWRRAMDSGGGLDAIVPIAGAGGGECSVVFLDGVTIGRTSPAGDDEVAWNAVGVARDVARNDGARLWIVTRGAQAVRGDPDVVAPMQAALWGLGRTFALEHPLAWGGIVDLDPLEDDAVGAAALALLLTSRDGEDQMAWRAGRRVVPRIVPAAPPAASRVTLRNDAAYLVTGGLGGIGLELAAWLGRRGAGHLVLAGRTPLPPREAWDSHGDDARIAAIQRLEAAGVRVEPVAVDIGDPTAFAALLDGFGRVRPPLAGVLHAAVAPTAASIVEMPRERWSAMFRTKVGAAHTLLAHPASRALDFFVSFSTTTAVLGSAELAHYAGANAVLDALASHERTAGRRLTSIDWGSWDRLQSVDAAGRARIARGGLRPMPVSEGLAALEMVVASSLSRAVVADVDWPVLRAVYETRRPMPMLSRVAAPAASALVASSPARVDPFALPAAERLPALERIVVAELGATLGVGPDGISTTRTFFEMGMDSLMAVEIRGRLERALDRPLPAALAFNYPRVPVLAEFLAGVNAAADESAGAEQVLLDRLPEMSDAEVDALLAKLMLEEGSA